MADIRLLTEDKLFRDLEPHWNGLWRDSNHQSPFMSWEWISTWWKYFGKGRLHIPTLWQGEVLMGAAPLFSLQSPWGMKSLRMLGTEQSDYLDFLMRRENETELYLELLTYLMTEKGFDLIFLEQVPPQRLQWIKELSSKHGRVVQIRSRGQCYSARLPGRFDDYLNGLGKNERYNIRRRTRSLEQIHGVQFLRIHQPGPELQKGMEIFYELMERRLATRGRQPAVQGETKLLFLKELAEQFAKQGWLALYGLYQQGKMIAGLLSFEYSRKLFYYHSGFNPAWSKYSLGMVLLAKSIEDGIKRGIQEFDFMRGRAAYKLKWNIEERKYHRVIIARGWVQYTQYLATNVLDRVRKKMNMRYRSQ